MDQETKQESIAEVKTDVSSKARPGDRYDHEIVTAEAARFLGEISKFCKAGYTAGDQRLARSIEAGRAIALAEFMNELCEELAGSKLGLVVAGNLSGSVNSEGAQAAFAELDKAESLPHEDSLDRVLKLLGISARQAVDEAEAYSNSEGGQG